MQKARRHSEKSELRPLVSVRFQVLFHSPVRGAFHLSLTVLVHYRSLSSIQPYQMVLADSDRISRVPPYSGYCQNDISYLYGTVTPYGQLFQNCSSSKYFFISQPYNPVVAETTTVQAIPSSLATTRGITFVFSSSGYLDVSVPRVCLPINRDILKRMGFPIRTSADRFVFANPRSFSQLVTSFIASESLGILRTPLVTFFGQNPRIDSNCISNKIVSLSCDLTLDNYF